MYAQIKDGEIVEYPILSLKTRFPRTSFPERIPRRRLPSGYVYIYKTVKPAHNRIWQRVKEVTPGYNEERQRWEQCWLIEDLSVDELQAKSETILAALTRDIQAYMDKTVSERGYDNIFTLCTYATSANPEAKAVGQAGVDWRDACWKKGNEIMNAVKEGRRTIPMSVDEVLSEMPTFTWPSDN